MCCSGVGWLPRLSSRLNQARGKAGNDLLNAWWRFVTPTLAGDSMLGAMQARSLALGHVRVVSGGEVLKQGRCVGTREALRVSKVD